jgi:hypothetical protein
MYFTNSGAAAAATSPSKQTVQSLLINNQKSVGCFFSL